MAREVCRPNNVRQPAKFEASPWVTVGFSNISIIIVDKKDDRTKSQNSDRETSAWRNWFLFRIRVLAETAIPETPDKLIPSITVA